MKLNISHKFGKKTGVKNEKHHQEMVKIADNEFFEQRGVLYIGHLPATFTEKALYEYFSQFGTITRLRLSRSKGSGRSKGYAFLEYEYREVAVEVAKAMNDYLLKNRFLKCQVIPVDKCHVKLFKGWNRKFQPSKSSIRHKLQVNKKPEEENEKKLEKTFKKKLVALNKKWPQVEFEHICHSDKPNMDEPGKIAKIEKVEEESPSVSENTKEPKKKRSCKSGRVTRRSERLKRKISVNEEMDTKKSKN